MIAPDFLLNLYFQVLHHICPGGAKVQVTVTGQVTGHRPQVTGHRSQATGQVTGHAKKTIGHWTILFWTDVFLYKNKISQGTLMIFLSFKQLNSTHGIIFSC